MATELVDLCTFDNPEDVKVMRTRNHLLITATRHFTVLPWSEYSARSFSAGRDDPRWMGDGTRFLVRTDMEGIPPLACLDSQDKAEEVLQKIRAGLTGEIDHDQSEAGPADVALATPSTIHVSTHGEALIISTAHHVTAFLWQSIRHATRSFRMAPITPSEPDQPSRYAILASEDDKPGVAIICFANHADAEKILRRIQRHLRFAGTVRALRIAGMLTATLCIMAFLVPLIVRMAMHL